MQPKLNTKKDFIAGIDLVMRQYQDENASEYERNTTRKNDCINIGRIATSNLSCLEIKRDILNYLDELKTGFSLISIFSHRLIGYSTGNSELKKKMLNFFSGSNCTDEELRRIDIKESTPPPAKTPADLAASLSSKSKADTKGGVRATPTRRRHGAA